MKLKMTIDKKKFKLSFDSVVAIFLFSYLVPLQYFESSGYSLIQYISLLIIASYSFLKLKNIKIDDLLYLFIVVIMGICIVYSSYHNGVSRGLLRSSIFYAAYIIIMCVFIIEEGNKNNIDKVLVGGKIYLLIALVINDILMFVLPNTFYNVSGREIGTMLLGNKFTVSYAHLMLMFIIVFLEENEIKQRIKVIVCAIILAIICLWVDCTTTLLADVIFVILYFIPLIVKKVLKKPVIFSISYIASAVILFIYSGILKLNPVKNFIVNVLHRDPTLTGRMEVYPYIYSIVLKSKWWGYGYENNIVKKTSKWYANAQNGFWDFVVNYGFITVMFMSAFLIMSVIRYYKCAHIIKLRGWIAFSMLYVYLFIAVGEIVFAKQFFFYIMLIWAICSSNYRRKKNNDE